MQWNGGIPEAVREFLQNARDEEIEHEGNEMLIDYDPSSQLLSIGNSHSVLEPRTLLLGQSSKRSATGLIGKHGEGYKVATVVLLRNNCNVTIYNNAVGEKVGS